MHPADPYDAGAGGAGALVPFNPAGPAADQSAEERLVQFPAYGIVLRLRQDPQASGSQRVGPGGSSRGCSGLTDEADEGGGVQWPQDEAPAGGSGRATPDLSNVGLVVWQVRFGFWGSGMGCGPACSVYVWSSPGMRTIIVGCACCQELGHAKKPLNVLLHPRTCSRGWCWRSCCCAARPSGPGGLACTSWTWALAQVGGWFSSLGEVLQDGQTMGSAWWMQHVPGMRTHCSWLTAWTQVGAWQPPDPFLQPHPFHVQA